MTHIAAPEGLKTSSSSSSLRKNPHWFVASLVKEENSV